MDRVGEIHSSFEPIDGPNDVAAVFNLNVRLQKKLFECRDNGRTGQTVDAAQDPLEFDDDALWNKDGPGSQCLCDGRKLPRIIVYEKADQDISICGAHAYA